MARQSGSICQLYLNWYNPIGTNKTQYTYDATDVQWIDIENVISFVNLTVKQGVKRIYVLDLIDKHVLDDFIKTAEWLCYAIENRWTCSVV